MGGRIIWLLGLVEDPLKEKDMASEKLEVTDKYGAQIVYGGSNGAAEEVGVPFLAMDAQLWAPGADGKPEMIASGHMPHNLVVHQGRALVLNRVFANATYNSNGCFLFLHNATQTTNASAVWSNISGQQVTGYGASIPAVTFATAQTAPGDTGTQLFTATASYGITAVQTVSGAGLLFYTSASCGTGAASNDVRLYCYGTFASLQAANPSTLSVTASLSAN
jgi:hypothetical protein